MGIVEATFVAEAELQEWAFANLQGFLPETVILPGFKVSTLSGKGGVPDGFAFALGRREWFVVECELLAHGVWPHIAEQITRFVVALQNPASRRTIRDKLFEHLVATGAMKTACEALNTVSERLLQQVEAFVEGIRPELVILIDDVDQDLQDMVRALDIPTRIFRVRKLLVDNAAQYYSPDQMTPAVVTEPISEDARDEFGLLEALGGGTVEGSSGRFKCYRLKYTSRDKPSFNIAEYFQPFD